jgi:hypothetical protein
MAHLSAYGKANNIGFNHLMTIWLEKNNAAQLTPQTPCMLASGWGKCQCAFGPNAMFLHRINSLNISSLFHSFFNIDVFDTNETKL